MGPLRTCHRIRRGLAAALAALGLGGLAAGCGGGSRSAEAGPPSPPQVRTFVFPHLLEMSGSILDTPSTFDTSIFITYTAGLVDNVDPAPGATVDLFLFDEFSGAPVQGSGPDAICNPCPFLLGPQQRKAVCNLDNLLDSAGYWDSGRAAFTGFVMLVVTGDPDAVAVQAVTTRRGEAATDLSVFVFEPQEIRAPPP